MSTMSLIIRDTVTLTPPKKRSILLTNNRHSDAAPIPPTLVNSPHLFSSNSIFRRKSSVLRRPTPQADEWLRDMIPLDRQSPPLSDADAKSVRSNDSTPSPTSSESSQNQFPFPPSPIPRPRSSPPEISAQVPPVNLPTPDHILAYTFTSQDATLKKRFGHEGRY